MSKGSSSHAWKCCWPEELKKQRILIPEAANGTYFGFLHGTLRKVSEIPDSSNETEDEAEDESDDDEYTNNDDKTIDQDIENAINGHNKVRVFMKGLEGDDRVLQQDQVEQVASFCERGTGESKRAVALLDIRNNGRSMRTEYWQSRPYLGPLTVPELVKELSKPRFSTSTNAFDDEEVDAERSLIFINGLDSASVEALATTASLSQAPALKSLFYKHITGRPSIDVNIPSGGFARFTLEFCIPYFVLKPEKKLRRDSRTKPEPDGGPLRQSWESCSSPSNMGSSAPADKVNCVYEAHNAIAVTGIDHQLWTAYCFTDTYFDDQDSVYTYHVDGDDRYGKPDPLLAGLINVKKQNFSDPRQYFFKAFECRMHIVVPKCTAVVNNVEKDIKQSRVSYSLASRFEIQQGLREKMQNWNYRKMEELRIYKDVLSELDAAWMKFKETELEYFDDIKYIVGPCFRAIDKEFLNLKGLLRKVEGLIKELCQDYPQGLHAQLSFENNEAAIFQQKSANHIQVLTYITIVFIPVAVASSLFGMQGVLPFTPTLTHFTNVLVILTILVVAMLMVLLKWETYLRPVLKSFHGDTASPLLHLFYRKLSDIALKGKRRGISVAVNIGLAGMAMARAILPRRHRRNRDLELEEGIGFEDV